MSVEPIIRFQDVSKRFVFTREKRQTIWRTVFSAFSQDSETEIAEDLWAVRNVSFDVLPGQSLGIVGRNGSGKSTLLKLMTRILRPTSGRIVVRGKVSALLELGAGFHPDLTGRENIFLNASLLGLDEATTRHYFDQIVDFSELGDFIEMPVKHYSSGMYMRLGFSVAIHMRPDVLIVDEILAVGDQAFQTKCMDAILELKRNGTTILLVSHNLHQMRQLCSHLVWMENGRIRAAGTTDEVAGQYQSSQYAQEGRQLTATTFTRHGTGQIELTAVRLLGADGLENSTFYTGDSLTVEMHYLAHQPIENPEFGLAIFRQDGVHVNGPNSQLADLQMGVVVGAGVVRYTIAQLPLLPARYQITTAIHDGRLPLCYDYHKEAYSFRVVSQGKHELEGLVTLAAQWDWQPTAVLTPTGQPSLS
jgi:ABC-type polysaccharide/polyol phosphate transport system ATPase subunit